VYLDFLWIAVKFLPGIVLSPLFVVASSLLELLSDYATQALSSPVVWLVGLQYLLQLVLQVLISFSGAFYLVCFVTQPPQIIECYLDGLLVNGL
jgi:hypothetical protein